MSDPHPPPRTPSQLNEPQAAAVAHFTGPLLVFAGAGSGKTRVITYRVANLIAEHRVPPYRILAVTFTNKAAGEMRERIARLAGADLVDDLWVGTFHATCARLLRRYHDDVGLTRQYSIYDDSDQKAIVGRVVKALGLEERRFPPRAVLGRISAEKREGRGPEEAARAGTLDEVVLDIYQRYQQALRKANAVDFDDLLLYVTRICEDPDSAAGRELRERFDHVLVDEFQDTNLIQYRMVRALAARTGNLTVVGDDDQSIYRWRGADVRLIRGFERDFPGAEVVRLEQNYRSSGNIVAAALGVISPARDRAPKQLWTASPTGEKVHVRAVRDERDEAAVVALRIAEEQRRGLDAGQIAIFYRVHAQSRVLEETLRSQNIAYQIVGGMKFFERAEVKDALAYLRLIDNPQSDADLSRIVNVPARGIGGKTVERLFEVAAAHGLGGLHAIDAALRENALGTGAKKRLRGFQELMARLSEQAAELGPHDLCLKVFEETGYTQALEAADSAEADARLGNLQELAGSIADYEATESAAGRPPTLQGYLERVSLVTAIDTLENVPAVSLMTVHAAKGLEFTSVVLTGMEEEIFPYRGLDADQIEDLEEERRLAYVAITRARERLLITHAGQRTLFGRTRYLESSRFLRDLPQEVIVHQGSPAAAQRSVPSRWPTRGVSAEAASWTTRPEQPLQPGERVVDRTAFNDLPQDEIAEAIGPGATVRHARFGTGVVERVEPGANPIVVARFPGHGTRRIVAQYLEFD